MPSVSLSNRRSSLTRTFLWLAVGVCLLLPCTATAQIFKPQDLAPAPTRQPNSLEARTQTLNEIFRDYWQDKLKHSPEMASTIGDHRYDDQLSDYSPQAYNDALGRGEGFIERLGAIDTTGMSEQEKLSKELLVHDLVDQQEFSVCKPWQTPVTQFSGIQVDLPALVDVLRFASVDDYDHYVARLNKVPAAFLQISTDMVLGEEAGRSEPQSVMQKVLVQVKAIASAKPEDTPFARPLQRFPAGMSSQQQAEIRTAVLTAIRTKVQPAYLHFARYLAADYIPKANPNFSGAAHSDRDVCSSSLDADSRKILELRIRAQKQLGRNFDLQAFHDEIVNHGAVPLDILERRVEAWIQEQQTHPANNKGSQ